MKQSGCYNSFEGDASWVILTPIEQSIKQKIEAVGTPLKDWDINIYRGVLTGCNEAFIISTEKRDEILANCRTEDERKRTEELIRPILRGRDIKRYGYNWAGLWLIYIPWHFPFQFDESIKGASPKAEKAFMELYPTVYNHMLQYKEPLSKRNKAETEIRYEWYAMQRWGAKYWDVYDINTGELFDPEDFCDKDGNPKSLSDSTIRNILNKPKNRLIWDKSQLSWSSYMHEAMPHMHRHQGEYSLSQITMDDVDLTRKLKDTKLRVKAYYAYDVVSQCVIGASYSRDKDQYLVRDCFRDMFRLIAKHGWGIPAGIEVENHLMTDYKYTLLQEGTVFSHVRFCAPLNSQEKYAEAMNGAKKRRIIHRNHTGIGRFYGKWKWRAESKKISDASNDTYEDKDYYSFEELVADDRRDNYEWNHTLHPNQKKYKGMTRWDVLMENINPQLKPFDAVTLARYIGEKVETSVRRNSTVRVAYEDWWLSSPQVLEKLAPNNYKVTAYYLPDEDGKPQDVFIFQGDRYIDQVERVETYNRVMAEQTEEDKRKFYHQQKKVREFNEYTDSIMVPKVGTMEKTETTEPPPKVEEIEMMPPPIDDVDALLASDESEEDIIRRAREMI